MLYRLALLLVFLAAMMWLAGTQIAAMNGWITWLEASSYSMLTIPVSWAAIGIIGFLWFATDK